jgi:Cytochrome c554 and c-prime
LLLALFSILGLTGAASYQSSEKNPRPPSDYAGNAVCAECHQKQAQTYATTAHALDSAPATADSIRGDFTHDHAVLRTRDPKLVFVMVAAPDGGFYQSAVNLADPEHPSSEMRRFDITFGSGRHGQTYLYWDGDRLFELPVSYWTYEHRWVNSPGYPDGQLHWDRHARPRCLECHVSYFSSLPPPDNRYAKDKLVLGIDCERCHGPGALHVARERSTTPPRAGSSDEAIVNPAHLSRDRQTDLCALCHAGIGTQVAPVMTYVAGDNLNDFLKIEPPALDAPVDVHGNQVGALEQSRCFRSGKLTCSTCHDVHKTQENADAFSVHCLSCHKVKACGRYRSMGAAIAGKCIGCHMPVAQSKAVFTANAGQQMAASMRTHRIAIYPDAKLEPASARHTEADR